MSFQIHVPEYPTVRPDGSLWRHGYVKPVEEYLKHLKDITPLSADDSTASDWSDDESDNASTEAQRDSEEDLNAEPAVDIDPNNNNVVLVNGPASAEEAEENSLGSSPDCSLGEA